MHVLAVPLVFSSGIMGCQMKNKLKFSSVGVIFFPYMHTLAQSNGLKFFQHLYWLSGSTDTQRATDTSVDGAEMRRGLALHTCLHVGEDSNCWFLF